MSKTTEELLASIKDAPPPGSRWKHVKSGNTYILLGACIIEATLEVGVIYSRCEVDRTKPLGLETTVLWMRPLAEFLEKFVKEESR